MNKLRLLNTIKKPVYTSIRFNQVKIESNKPSDNKITDNKKQNTWNNKGEDNNEWAIVVFIMFLITASLSSK